MKTWFTLLFSTTIISVCLAQFDQVSIGPAYSNQAYYSFSTGEVVQVPNSAWDIAFSNLGQRDGGIFINEATTFMGSPVSVYLAEGKTWDDAISASEFSDATELLNPEKSWEAGAFNVPVNPGNPLDFGWGAYNPQTHQVEGDRLFVVRKRNGDFVKFEVVSLASGKYTVRYANLDGSNEQMAELSKGGDSPLLYLSLDDGVYDGVPSSYDLVFQRYSTPLPFNGSFIDYTVTGALLSPGTKAVKVSGENPSEVDFDTYRHDMKDSLLTIGHTWKDYNGSWTLQDNLSFFVRTNAGDVYHLRFEDFQGATTGTTILEKRLVGNVAAVQSQISEADVVDIFPNPATDYIQVKNAQGANIFITDMTGRSLMAVNNYQGENINTSHLSSGTYQLLSIKNGVIQSISLLKF